MDVLRLYFAALTGAVRGCFSEVEVVNRDIARRRLAGAGLVRAR